MNLEKFRSRILSKTKAETIHAKTANENGSLLALKHVIKKFPLGETEVTILKDISLAIQPGEFMSVVGPSGSGKSTLLNMMTGIDRPSSGEVVIVGCNLHEMTETELAVFRGEHVGIIFQFFQMLPALSLLHNIVLPMDFAQKYDPRERPRRAMQLLEMVGLADQANKLPGMVSGGQQQRAAVARALANDPHLIIADEPTGNLDSVSTNKIFDLFHHLIEQDKTVIMVTHDKDLANQVPRQVEIRDGCITQDRCLKSLVHLPVADDVSLERHTMNTISGVLS